MEKNRREFCKYTKLYGSFRNMTKKKMTMLMIIFILFVFTMSTKSQGKNRKFTYSILLQIKSNIYFSSMQIFWIYFLKI